MKNFFGKKYSLKNKKTPVKNIKPENFNNFFKKKTGYFNNLSKQIKKKIFKNCIICRDYFFDWEENHSFAQEDFHRNDHPSKLICPKFFPMYCFDWCHEEENQFLKAVFLFGFSNWNMVSLLMGTKTPSECEGHFFKFYGELGLKNKKKSWRISPFGCFSSHFLKKWQEFLPICNLKIEKKSGWLPQRCEFLNELEENFEGNFNDFYQKHKKKFELKILDRNFFFSKYNRKIFFRELRKKTICYGNFSFEPSFDETPFDDSFFTLIQKIKRGKKEKNSITFKKPDRFLKKTRRSSFYGWVINYNHESKYLFEYFCAFNSFIFREKPAKNEFFFKYLFLNKNFENFVHPKLFLEKSILTGKEKIICCYAGLDPFQFLLYKTGIIFANFFFLF